MCCRVICIDNFFSGESSSLLYHRFGQYIDEALCLCADRTVVHGCRVLSIGVGLHRAEHHRTCNFPNHRSGRAVVLQCQVHQICKHLQLFICCFLVNRVILPGSFNQISHRSLPHVFLCYLFYGLPRLRVNNLKGESFCV